MMDAYFDSAIIVKLYVQETTSPDAIRLVAAYAAPYLITQWQGLEFKNAIRLKVFRGEITLAEMSQSIAAFEQDFASGRWQRPAYAVAAVEQKAEELSAVHAATLGCRTLDIVHSPPPSSSGRESSSVLMDGSEHWRHKPASR